MTEQDDTRARRRTHAAPSGILAPAYAATTIGMFALIAIVAFEAMAVVTVMPTIARDLDGVPLYALSFAAPLASGVDRHGRRRRLERPARARRCRWSSRSSSSASAWSPAGPRRRMEVLVAGRVLQGLGGGALTVGLYVVVGLVYAEDQQPAVFASFAAAWVLPSLFGPGLAAAVAHAWGWRWVFLSVVVPARLRDAADRAGAARAAHARAGRR